MSKLFCLTKTNTGELERSQAGFVLSHSSEIRYCTVWKHLCGCTRNYKGFKLNGLAIFSGVQALCYLHTIYTQRSNNQWQIKQDNGSEFLECPCTYRLYCVAPNGSILPFHPSDRRYVSQTGSSEILRPSQVSHCLVPGRAKKRIDVQRCITKSHFYCTLRFLIILCAVDCVHVRVLYCAW